jgi:hypothetical protein
MVDEGTQLTGGAGPSLGVASELAAGFGDFDSGSRTVHRARLDGVGPRAPVDEANGHTLGPERSGKCAVHERF